MQNTLTNIRRTEGDRGRGRVLHGKAIWPVSRRRARGGRREAGKDDNHSFRVCAFGLPMCMTFLDCSRGGASNLLVVA
jgi:hypothetical protein